MTELEDDAALKELTETGAVFSAGEFVWLPVDPLLPDTELLLEEGEMFGPYCLYNWNGGFTIPSFR